VVKETINSELADKSVYTTTFVLREFLRTIIADVAYVHSMLKDLPVRDGRVALGALSRLLAQGKNNYSPRAARREQYVIGAIVDYFSETIVPLEKLRCLLEMTVREWINDFFEVPVAGPGYPSIPAECLAVLDETPDEMTVWINSRYPMPTNPPIPKKAADFLLSHRGEITKIEEALEIQSNKSRDVRMLATLSLLKNKAGEFDFTAKLNRRNIWALGDLFITLETPRSAMIYTTDKHYELLCSMTGRSQYSGYLPRKSIGTGSGSRT